MIIVDNALKSRHAGNNPIRVGMIGAGFMARGIALQICNYVPGMKLAAIANRHMDGAKRAYAEAGVDKVSVVENELQMQDALRKGEAVVTEDALLVCRAEGIDQPPARAPEGPRRAARRGPPRRQRVPVHRPGDGGPGAGAPARRSAARCSRRSRACAGTSAAAGARRRSSSRGDSANLARVEDILAVLRPQVRRRPAARGRAAWSSRSRAGDELGRGAGGGLRRRAGARPPGRRAMRRTRLAAARRAAADGPGGAPGGGEPRPRPPAAEPAAAHAAVGGGAPGRARGGPRGRVWPRSALAAAAAAEGPRLPADRPRPGPPGRRSGPRPSAGGLAERRRAGPARSPAGLRRRRSRESWRRSTGALAEARAEAGALRVRRPPRRSEADAGPAPGGRRRAPTSWRGRRRRRSAGRGRGACRGPGGGRGRAGPGAGGLAAAALEGARDGLRGGAGIGRGGGARVAREAARLPPGRRGGWRASWPSTDAAMPGARARRGDAAWAAPRRCGRGAAADEGRGIAPAARRRAGGRAAAAGALEAGARPCVRRVAAALGELGRSFVVSERGPRRGSSGRAGRGRAG